MANKQRGEVEISINGKAYPMCMTLGRLAELEDVLGVTTAGQLDAIISAPTYSQILKMTHSLVNFGTDEVLSMEDLKASDLVWAPAWFAIMDAVKATNPTPSAEGKSEGLEKKP